MSSSTARVPSIWTTGWTDQLNTGTWRNAIAVHQKRPAPCHGACPVNGEIPVWVGQVREGDLKGAWETLVAHNPLPAVIGRTCHHPCEGSCNRRELDGAVAVNALEQHVGDLALREGWRLPEPEAESDLRVAVIGGGPAGLSCAYQLRRKGFRVTIYDANPELGGVLRYGVPEYRLPKRVLAAEIARLVALGIEVVPGRKVSAADLERLEREHAAIFIAFGAQLPKGLPQFPKDDPRVLDALSFLRSVRQGAPLALGERVVVIGGGSVAMDVAGSALRLGSSVRIVALEGREALPAPAEEVEDVLEEGALLFDGALVQTIDGRGAAFELCCVKAELDPAAPAGVLRPVEIKGTGFNLDADTVILAVGQDPELAEWEAALTVHNRMVVIDHRYLTSRPGLFAAGDAASAERFVSTAIGDGKRAAESIASYLTGAAPAEPEAVPLPEVAFSDINAFYFEELARKEREKRDPGQRLSGFEEVREGFAADPALAQAERCFSCGACVECDNCFYFCPDQAIAKDPAEPLHYRVLDQYCKGCGCCVAECPRGAVGAREETK